MTDSFADLCERVDARARDCPGKLWHAQPFDHPAIARALHVDKADPASTYALMPFRYCCDEEGVHHILAAWPTPRCLGPVDADWLDVEIVFSWCPVKNTAEIVGDINPQVAGRLDDAAPALYGDPFAFFRAWAEARAAFLVEWQWARRTGSANLIEPDLIPGALIVGDVDKITWMPSALPQTLQCIGTNPKQIERAIFRAARLPRCIAAERKAA